MQWNPADTVTIGSIFGGFILVFLSMLQFARKSTAPSLVPLLTKQLDTFTKLSESIEESTSNARIATKNTAMVFNELLQAFRAAREEDQNAHREIANTLALIHDEKQSSHQGIKKGVDSANRSLENVEGGMEAMVTIMSDSANNYTEVKDAIDLLTRSVNNLIREVQQFGEDNRKKESSWLLQLKSHSEQITAIQKKITQETPTVSVGEKEKPNEQPERKSTGLASVSKRDSRAVKHDDGDDSKTISASDHPEASNRPESV